MQKQNKTNKEEEEEQQQQIPLSLYVFVQGWLYFMNKAMFPLCHNIQLV